MGAGAYWHLNKFIHDTKCREQRRECSTQHHGNIYRPWKLMYYRWQSGWIGSFRPVTPNLYFPFHLFSAKRVNGLQCKSFSASHLQFSAITVSSLSCCGPKGLDTYISLFVKASLILERELLNLLESIISENCAFMNSRQIHNGLRRKPLFCGLQKAGLLFRIIQEHNSPMWRQFIHCTVNVNRAE